MSVQSKVNEAGVAVDGVVCVLITSTCTGELFWPCQMHCVHSYESGVATWPGHSNQEFIPPIDPLCKLEWWQATIQAHFEYMHG